MKDKIGKLCEGGNWFGKTSETILNSYEQFLNLDFPDDYRMFFLEYGSGSKGGIEIAGYDPIIISDQNIIAKTILEQRDYYFYPRHYLFFSDTGDGGQICFDKNTWQVFEVYKRMPDGISESKIADNFLNFLENEFGIPSSDIKTEESQLVPLEIKPAVLEGNAEAVTDMLMDNQSPKEISQADAEWLIEHIESSGQMDDDVKALLKALKENANIPSILSFKLKFWGI